LQEEFWAVVKVQKGRWERGEKKAGKFYEKIEDPEGQKEGRSTW
jgi:hypothetical protein